MNYMKQQLFISTLFWVTTLCAQSNDAESKPGVISLDSANMLIATYTQQLSAAPNNAVLYYKRAEVKSRLLNFKDAIADYTHAIETDTAYADAYYQRVLLKVKFCDY